MFEIFNIETFKAIYIEIVLALCSGCLGMIIYRNSVIYKLRENDAVSKAAYKDALTGKGNRHKFNIEIQKLVENTNNKFALCVLDLDGFKHINDNMGHDAGDELLTKLSDAMQSAMPDNGEIYRLGGDEFAIIYKDIDDKLEAEENVKKLNMAVKEPMIVRDTKINLEYSLGIAVFPEDSKDYVELLNFADAAMYHVKETGKNGYYFHNESLKAKVENKSKMENDLKKAYENKEFDIDFQPRINVKNENDIWLEALLYWNHSTLGKLRAQYFLNFIESIGLIISVDEIVLEKTIDKLIELKAKGYSKVKIAMNMSLRHFMRTDFIDRICNILKKKNFDRGSLMLEITDLIDESKIEDYKLKMDKLKEYGVKISVNNLDVKYEIMNLFKKLPVDEVKISAEYVEKSSQFNSAVLSDIVELGKDLYYEVTVVKVENDRELEKALKCKVDKIQGNYIYKPLDETELYDFLDKYNEIRENILSADY